jgi:hypothetical protein
VGIIIGGHAASWATLPPPVAEMQEQPPVHPKPIPRLTPPTLPPSPRPALSGSLPPNKQAAVVSEVIAVAVIGRRRHQLQAQQQHRVASGRPRSPFPGPWTMTDEVIILDLLSSYF